MLRNSYVKPYHDSVHLHQFSHAYSNGTFLKPKQEPKNFLYYVGTPTLDRAAPPLCKTPLLSTTGHRNAYQTRARAESVSSVASCVTTETGSDIGELDAPGLPLQAGMSEVPAWLKSLRLHKYKELFADLSYEQMLSLTEQQLELRNVTKGARHKIIVNIEKLKARQSNLANLEKSLPLEGVSGVRQALNELKQVLHTPIKAFSGRRSESVDLIVDGDLSGQIIRLLEIIQSCLQIETLRDEECINLYLICCDKCLAHEAFTPFQKQKLVKSRPKIEQFKHVAQQKKWSNPSMDYANPNTQSQTYQPSTYSAMTPVNIVPNHFHSSPSTSSSSSSSAYSKFACVNQVNPPSHFTSQFGKQTVGGKASLKMTTHSNGPLQDRDSNVKLAPYAHCANGRDASNALHAPGNGPTAASFTRPASVCSDRFVNSSQNSASNCSGSMFNDVPNSFNLSGRHTPLSGFLGTEGNQRSNRLGSLSGSRNQPRNGTESPDLFAMSGISSSSSTTSSSGSTSGVDLNPGSSMHSVSLASSEMFAVCSQIGLRSCGVQSSSFGMLDSGDSHPHGLSRLNGFVYGTHEQLDMGPFKMKSSPMAYGDLQSENSMNNINIMTGFGRAGTSRSALFPDLHAQPDESIDENSQIYSHIELLSLQMTEQALDSSDYS